MITKIRDTDRVLINTLLESKNYKDILSLLSTNKYLLRLGEETLKQRMFSTHPVLAKRKPFFENWRSYYLKTLHNINKLKEEFNIDYIPTPSFDPEGFYHGLYVMKINKFTPSYFNENKFRYMANYLSEYGDEKLILKCLNSIDKYARLHPYSDLVSALVKHKRLDILDKLDIDLNFYYGDIIQGAAASGDPTYFKKIMKRKIKVIGSVTYYGLPGAGESGSIEMTNYILENYGNGNICREKLFNMIYSAAINGHVGFLNSLLIPENSYLANILNTVIGYYLTDKIFKQPFLTEEKSVKVLRTLLEGYKRISDVSLRTFVFVKDPYLKNFL